MNQRILALLFILFALTSFAQNPPVLQRQDTGMNRQNDSLNRNGRRSSTRNVVKNLEAKIQDYKVISYKNDTTFVDTSLTIQKTFKFNYLRKDYFDLVPFNNIGQTFNSLSYDFDSQNVLPNLGARARHYNHMEIEDINYYMMATPFTELFYKTAFEQGQVLDAFFSSNLHPRLNFSIAYKGLRSLGKYQHILTSTGNFRITSNYRTENRRYLARGHIVLQDQLNEENGGIRDEDIVNFESGDPEFSDRSVFDPNFQDAEGILVGRRYFIDQKYNIVMSNDSVSKNDLSVGNVTYYKDKYFRFEQSSPNEIFGDAFTNTIRNRANLEHFYTEGNVKYSNNTIGNVGFNIGYTRISYGYNSIVEVNGERIPNRINDNIVSVGGSYQNQIGKLNINGEATVNISGSFEGSDIRAKVAYDINDDLSVEGGLLQNSRRPNYNFLLHQSDYLGYNWQNDYSNTNTYQLFGHLISKKWFNIDFDYTTVNNFTYFLNDENGITKPAQYDQAINYFRLKAMTEIPFGKFVANASVRYQNVLDGEDVLRVPDLNIRGTVYYANQFFKKALYLQTGVTCSYFTEYFMNGYDPVLAEFYIQNERKFGGFPRLDFFVNVKIRQTRIYLIAEHFNSSFTGYDYYSAPNYPYRDFNVRFGLVWNFFL